MRIVQIIDSLEAGGAERMAVNYANALATSTSFSGLVATRKEGALKTQINENVNYLFLNKRGVVDLKSVITLRRFIITNKVNVIHAHSTSFFFAFLLKITYPNVKMLWHDHYGDSEFLKKRKSLFLQLFIPFFDGIIAVNNNLKIWAEQKLGFKNVIYLPNFPSKPQQVLAHTFLHGVPKKRIVSLANLRIQKNHYLLIDVAKKLKQSHPEWSFHLIGKDFEDDYSSTIKNLIVKSDLENSVFIYGSKNDISNILNQSTIGILTSQSEGLPVALLEYGLHKMPVVVTAVGEIPLIIQDGINGFLVVSECPNLFYNAIVQLIQNEVYQKSFGSKLSQTIEENYSEKTVIKGYIKWLENIKNE